MLSTKWIPSNWICGQEFANIVYDKEQLLSNEERREITRAEEDIMYNEFLTLKVRLYTNTERI